LIPRPETELLVDRARERLRGAAAPRVLDVGTGSGCIAATIALEVPGARVVAVERSAAALGWARANVARLAAPVALVRADALLALRAARDFALIVANPPYVAHAEAPDLAREVREHEPLEALLAPPDDPDHWVRRLLDEAPARLAAGGALLVELGLGQAARAFALARARGLDPRSHRDLSGIERVLEVEISGARV
jgi:release factor glutamine methyltransferase